MIIVHGGTNNMPVDTPEVFLRKYQTSETIRTTRPDARIVLSGILPRRLSKFPDVKPKPAFIDRY